MTEYIYSERIHNINTDCGSAGLDIRGMIDWIAAGLPFDIVHAAGNFCFGILAVPLIKVFRRLYRLTET